MASQIRFSELWRWDDSLDRGPYAVLGVGLFGIKFILDRLVAKLAFDRDWSLWSYFEAPLQRVGRINSMTSDDVWFLATMAALALPFIYVGVVMTLRRLQSAQLPSWLVLFFFVPCVNLIFFAVLAVLPGRSLGGLPPPGSGRSARKLERFIPRQPFYSALMAVGVVVPFSILLVVFSVDFLEEYGWGLFVGIPFAIGLVSALLHGYHEPRTYWSCLKVATLAISILGFALLLIAMEGLFCLIMAAPLALVLAGFGALIGYLIQRRRQIQGEVPALLIVLGLSLPGLMGVERAASTGPPLFEVKTSIEIQAPPEQVWREVVAFTEIAPPTEWYFRIGIAHPIRAEIQGKGVGAIRKCIFSTGPFIEPIQVWDEPRLLKFSVDEQPLAMKELSPYDIHPPHIDHFLVSKGGQFLLTPLPGGGTRLEGTTWYEHKIWPTPYWRLWSDWLLHRIHWRVLDHIRQRAEQT